VSAVDSLCLEHVGQIVRADIDLADLTVLVGPQATGKSIFLQFLKLALDTGYVHDQLRKHGIQWQRSVPAFLDVYLGDGMGGVWHTGREQSAVAVNGSPADMASLATRWKRTTSASAFYIPAQRVLSLSNGWPKPFQAFSAEDPFAVRDFSETFRLLMEQEFAPDSDLFPKVKRLKKSYRDLLTTHVFAGASLFVDRHGAQKRVVLRQPGAAKSIPFMAWSAGQREFVPLLMGLYWLLPAAGASRRGEIKTAMIEEPEMGLHPYAVSVVMLLVLELLWRGYRIVISTHSPQVLDVVWALSTIRAYNPDSDVVLDLFGASHTLTMRNVATTALKKTTRVFYFGRDGRTRDISNLNPGSEDVEEAGWGGLSEFTGHVNETVARVVSEAWGR
jgi:hypothetical protein